MCWKIWCPTLQGSDVRVSTRPDYVTKHRVEDRSQLPFSISCVIRKDTPSPEDSENRDVQIIYQASLVGKMFTRDSTKVLDILKELTLGTDADTRIKGIKYGRTHQKDHRGSKWLEWT